MMPRVSSAPPVSMSAPPAPQLAVSPVSHMPVSAAPLSHMSAGPPPQMSPMTPPVSTARPLSTSYMPTVNSPPVPKFMTAPTPPMSAVPMSPLSINTSMVNIAPQTLLSPSMPKAPAGPLSPPPRPGPVPQQSIPFSSTNNSQSFSYARPKEFITAQTLSPVRSPSPTESPVPLLHELAAELNLKLAREAGSVLSPASSISNFPTSPRVFHTRVLEPPTSPPAYISSPTLVPPAFLNSPLLRAQSPPQASSPTSSSSTPSPIQNPVAFLSSVLPSLPSLGSQSTNAMGLPKRAPTL